MSKEESLKNESWMDEVRRKLGEVFQDKDEDLCRVLFFLDEEDKAYKENTDRPYAPHWKSLKATLKMDKAFKVFAERLAEETKKAEKDQEFRNLMNKVYEEMMEYSDQLVPEEECQGFDLVRLTELDVASTSAFVGLTRAWNIIPFESQESILKVIGTLASKPVTSAVDDIVSLANKSGGTVVMVGLVAVHLTYTAYVNIKRWRNGEITGKRCIKNLLDTAFSSAAGAGGGFAGAALGSSFGPVGTVTGGVIGGWLSAAGANLLSDRLTQWLFGLPKDEALENAYNYLGVKMTASNAEINTAFRKLCLTHHPDKPGGSNEEFFILQCYMATIKVARGGF